MSHLFLTHPEFETALTEELLPEPSQSVSTPSDSRSQNRCTPNQWDARSDIALNESTYLAFACQTLPNAEQIQAVSINKWADRIIESIFDVLPDQQPWQFHFGQILVKAEPVNIAVSLFVQPSSVD